MGCILTIRVGSTVRWTLLSGKQHLTYLAFACSLCLTLFFSGIPPGNSFTYEVDLNVSQQWGTYWIHAHSNVRPPFSYHPCLFLHQYMLTYLLPCYHRVNTLMAYVHQLSSTRRRRSMSMTKSSPSYWVTGTTPTIPSL